MRRHVLSKMRRTAGRQIARDSNRHVLTSYAYLKQISLMALPHQNFIDGTATSEFRTAAMVALHDRTVSYDVTLLRRHAAL